MARPETSLPDDLASLQLPDPGVSRTFARKRRGRSAGFRSFRLQPRWAIEEQPYKEIAEALGISTGAVKLRVFRALRLLRKELKRQGIEP
jgi:hypothetical protein